jgi:hypothetical protein
MQKASTGDQAYPFSFWNGERWSAAGIDVEDALAWKGLASSYQSLPWRGIYEAPEAPQSVGANWLPMATAPDGEMLLFLDMAAQEVRHMYFCGWRHNGLRADSVQMPDNTARSATHWMRIPPFRSRAEVTGND